MSYDLLRLSLLFRRFVHATERSKIAFSCASASRPPSPPPAHSNPPCLARRAAAAAATRLDSSGRASLARRAALDSLDLRSSRAERKTSFSLSEEVAWSESKTQQPGGLTPIRSVSEYLVTKQVRRVLRFTAKVQSIVSTEVQTVARRLAH